MSADGKYEDNAFACRVNPKAQVNPKALYISGQAPKVTGGKKVDGCERLSALGSSSATPSAVDAKKMVVRDGLADSWLLAAIGMVQTQPALLEKLEARLEKECYVVNPQRPLATSLALEDLQQATAERMLTSSGSPDKPLTRSP